MSSEQNVNVKDAADSNQDTASKNGNLNTVIFLFCFV